ncbi:MAG: anthranilate synthase component I family protein [Polyangiaceae bacterium]|nr:anthranilate synthase component I family protein [Polyangiaceae bacterium]
MLKGRYFELPIDLPADALALGRRLRQRPDLAVLLDTSGATPAYIACDAVGVSHDFDPEPDLPLDPNALRFPRWIGVLPYEAGRGWERHAVADARPLPHLVRPEWRRYDAIIEVTDAVRILGTDEQSALALKQHLLEGAEHASDPVRAIAHAPEEAPGVHLERIRVALEHISAGDLYQVNLARRAEFKLEGCVVDILERLLERTDGPFCAALALSAVDVVANSPELFLSLDADGRAASIPIKGTRPRGKTSEEDVRLKKELGEDPKEHAELVMVVDVVRNDLGRIAATGSVRVEGGFQVESFRSVHHRGARVVAELATWATREDLFRATLPSGSVTGAPKARAMELIAQLEAHRRGIYTGAFGSIHQDGSVRLGMAIRTLTRVRNTGVAHYFAGGGIVADSVPTQEVEETRWKASHLAALYPS